MDRDKERELDELMERSKKNMAEFERLNAMNEEYERRKAQLFSEADSLGIGTGMEIPWDQLTPEQKRKLEDMKEEAERTLKWTEEAPSSSKTIKPAAMRMRV